MPTTKTTATASARKSLGEYKPLIKYPNGRTEVCEQSSERRDTGDVRAGGTKGNRMARGTVYATRAEAVAAAQALIDLRLDDARKQLALGQKLGRDTRYALSYVALWGG